MRSNAALAALLPHLPSNAYAARMDKGLNSTAEHAIIIKLLRLALTEELAEYRLCMVFDAVQLHLAD